MFKIMCGEYEDVRPVEMDARDLGVVFDTVTVFSGQVGNDVLIFTDRVEAELFVMIYNLGCSLRCDRAFVEEI